MTTAVKVKDLKSIIRDTVSRTVADKIIDAREAAKRDAAARDPFKLSNVRELATPGKGLAFARAVRCIMVSRANGTSPEAEAKAIAAKFPTVARAYQDIAEAFQTARALSTSAPSTGGVFVPENLSSEVIELLMGQTVAIKLGALTTPFPGNLTIGRINSGVTIGYVGEEQLITPSQPSTGAIKLSGKKAAALVAVTNDLLAKAPEFADAILLQLLLDGMAQTRERSFYRGVGSEAAPKGIRNWINASNKQNQSGTTYTAAISDYLDLVRKVVESNVNIDGAAFVMSFRTKAALMKMVDGNGNKVFPELAADKLFGFAVGISGAIPNTLNGSNSEVYFGQHRDAFLAPDSTRPLEVVSVPNGAYSDGTNVVAGLSNDTTPVRILESHDVALRHDNTFALLEQVTIT